MKRIYTCVHNICMIAYSNIGFMQAPNTADATQAMNRTYV